MMMNYSEFIEYCEDNILDYLPAEYENADVELTKTLKNNNVVLDTLRVQREEEKISPLIYLNRIYEDYREGKSIEKILTECAHQINTAKLEPEQLEIASHITDYDMVKDLISARVCNAKENTEFLASKPHRIENDLAVYYIVNVFRDENGIGSVTIDNSLLSSMKITAQELDETAIKNVEKEAEVQNFSSLLSEIIPGDFNSMDDMWIVTNQQKVNGAIAILSPAIREQLADTIGGDYYILPSSIHEVIVLPKSKDCDANELKDMVQGVNQQYVSSDERLSDNVYEYSVQEKKMKLANEVTLEKDLDKKQEQTKTL